jgi:hypothetical protein
VIDRHLHAPVEDFLTQYYSDRPFDVVIDAYGSQTLFDKSLGFLKTDGAFVTVGIAAEALTYMAMLQVVYHMLTNILWPRAIGGTPRKYVQVASTVSIEKMVKLRRLCENGELKVVVDSCWGVEDVEKVRGLVTWLYVAYWYDMGADVAGSGIRSNAKQGCEREGNRSDGVTPWNVVITTHVSKLQVAADRRGLHSMLTCQVVNFVLS